MMIQMGAYCGIGFDVNYNYRAIEHDLKLWYRVCDEVKFEALKTLSDVHEL